MNTRPLIPKRFATVAMMVIATSLLFATSIRASAEPVGMPFMSILYFDAVMQHFDLNTASALVAPDAMIHTPDGDFTGPDGAGRFAARLHDAFSSTTFVTEEPSIDGGIATVHWTMYGVHTGRYLGLAPACASVRLDGVSFMRFDDMQIVEQWISYDRQSLVDQITAFNATSAGSRPGCDTDWDLHSSEPLPAPQVYPDGIARQSLPALNG